MKSLALSLFFLACATTAQAQRTSLRDLQRWMADHTTAVEVLPTDWRGWWDDLAARCACTPAVRFEQLELSTAPGSQFQLPRRFGSSLAAWLTGGIIVIADERLHDRRVVQHEMLHAMLGLANGDGHPPIFRKLGLDDERL